MNAESDPRLDMDVGADQLQSQQHLHHQLLPVIHQRPDPRQDHHIHDLFLLHHQHHQPHSHHNDQLPHRVEEDGGGGNHFLHLQHQQFQVLGPESSSGDMSYLSNHPSVCSFQDYLDPDSDPDADTHFATVNMSFGSTSSPSDNDAGSNGRSSAEDGSADENSVHVRGLYSTDSSVIEHFVASNEQQDMG